MSEANKQCIFCQIAKKEAPAKIEYEDKEVIAFWDKNPAAPVHILIIPKRHLESLNQLKEGDEKLIGKLILTAVKLAKKKGVSESGYRLGINTGPWSGQIVPHLHIHLLAGGSQTVDFQTHR